MNERKPAFPRTDSADDPFILQVYLYLDDLMDDREFAAFAAMIESDDAKRRKFIAICVQNEMINELRADHRNAPSELEPHADEESLMNLGALLEMENQAQADIVEAPTQDDAPSRVDSKHPLIQRYLQQQQASGPEARHYVIPKSLFYGGIAAVIAIVVAIFWPEAGNQNENVQPPGTERLNEITAVATLLEQVDAKWEGASNAPYIGGEIRNEPLRLVNGMARLRFENGAEVILRSPVSFKPLAVDQMRIMEGELVGLCPTEESRGFTVIAPNARIVDLGTEFAVRVANTGLTQTHVFDGMVELSGLSNGHLATEPIELDAGHALEVDPTGTKHTAITVNPLHFVRGREFDANVKAKGSPYQRWLASSYKLARDESLLVMFTFDGDDSELPKVTSGTLGETEITLEKLSRRPGRFGKGRSVSFFDIDSQAIFDVPGKHEVVTLVGWFRIDRLDHDLNALMMTDGYHEAGQIHWQLLRTGEIRLAQKTVNSDVTFQTSNNVIHGRLRQWIHLSCVINVPDGKVSFFVNGTLQESIPIKQPEPLQEVTMANASLGFWKDPDPLFGSPLRTFSGEIDEFLVFGRALDAAEIMSLYDNSRPE